MDSPTWPHAHANEYINLVAVQVYADGTLCLDIIQDKW